VPRHVRELSKRVQGSIKKVTRRGVARRHVFFHHLYSTALSKQNIRGAQAAMDLRAAVKSNSAMAAVKSKSS
jgi:hypothetical protein